MALAGDRRRREAIEGFERGGRADLQQEQLEMAILVGYLPQPLDEQDSANSSARRR